MAICDARELSPEDGYKRYEAVGEVHNFCKKHQRKAKIYPLETSGDKGKLVVGSKEWYMDKWKIKEQGEK